MNLMMINLAIAIIGTGISAYWDYKKGIVPDKLSHSMIILGAVLAPFIFNDLIFVYGLAAAVFGLGFLFYSFGQLGGGDVKLFTAIALLIPYYPETLIRAVSSIGIQPALPVYPFVASVFVFAGIIGPMFFISLSYHKKIRELKSEIKEFKSKNRKGLIFAVLVAPFAAFWLTLSPGFLIIFLPMALTLYLVPFKEDIIRLLYTREKSIEDLNDDDVLALEEIEEGKKDDLGLWRKTFTEFELSRVKERAEEKDYDKVKVCEDLPKFVPYIFVSLIANLVLGDVFFYIVTSTVIS